MQSVHNLFKKNFKQKKLKRFITLLCISLALGIATFAITLLFNKTKAEAAWFDYTWSYRTSIKIVNSGAADADKKVSLTIDTSTLITAGKILSTCADSRFTDVNGLPLRYYINTAGGACNTSSTNYFVLMPTINAGNTLIYHYYGNSSAQAGTESAQFSQSTFSPSSTASNTEEVGPGPIAYWKFDDGNGTTAYDSSQYTRNATLNSGPAWKDQDECMSGKCLYFDGVDDYVSASFTMPSDYTVSLWFKETGFLSNPSAFAKTIWGGNSNNCDLYDSGSGSIQFYGSGLKMSGTYNQKVWNHVTLTISGSNGQLFINGILQSTSSSVNPTCTNKYIGGGAASRWFNGFIDEPRIYNYVRTAQQIQTDYLQGAANIGSGASFGTNRNATGANLTNGLVGWWKMDESSWTNNCSTASVLDSSGNGNNGQACPNSTGPTGGATGKFGNGGSFDGSDDYVSIVDSASLSPTAAMSISLWFKPNSTLTSATARQDILYKGTSYYVLFNLAGNDGKISFIVENSGNHEVKTTTTTWTGSTWYHIQGTFDGATEKIYVNGTLENKASYSGTVVDGSTAITLGSRAGASPFAGIIDDVRIYNRALSPTEVQALYNYAPGPVAYYNLDENTGTTAKDISRNSNNGTLTNMASPATTTSGWTSSGKVGNAVNFDGTDDYISLPNDIDKSDRTGTITGWVKFNGNGSANTVNPVISLAGSAGTTGFVLRRWEAAGNCTTNRLELRVLNSAKDVCSTTALSNGIWYHIAVTADGSSYKIYINGVSDTVVMNIGTNTGNWLFDESLTGTTTTADIGRQYYNGSAYSFGKASIDDVKIYNYARTQSQILEDMNAHPIGGGAANSSMVAYYKFDEGQGTTANDSSGNSNTGTLTNMASPATSTSGWTGSGKFGKGLVFDGTNDYVNIGNATLNATAGTLSMWINPTTITSTMRPISDTGGYWYLEYQAGNAMRFVINDGGAKGTPSATISINTWSYLTATWGDNGYIRLYVNGRIIGSTAASSISNVTNSVQIGGITSRYYSGGTIDEVKIYNTALTPDQILLDYNQGKAAVLGSLSTSSASATTPDNSNSREYCVPGDTSTCTAPVGEWKLDEGTGTSANDTSGNSNTGTLTNGPTWVAGKMGSAVNFDGVDDYIDLGSNSSLYPTTGSWSLWIKPIALSLANSLGREQDFFSNQNGVTSGISFYNASGTNNIRFDAKINGAFSDIILVTSATSNTWYHLEVTYDGSTLKGYANGVLTASTTVSGVIDYTSASSTKIGRFGTTPTNYAKEIVDNVRIYNYARTPAQIAWEYNRGAPVAWYKFDECQGITIYNSAVTGNGDVAGSNGTLTIGATGTNTAAGTCAGASTDAWKNGVNGKVNSSMSFDGTDDYASVTDPANGSLDFGTGPMSLSVWIKTSATSLSQYIVDKKSGGANTAGYNLRFNSSNGLVWSVANGTTQATATITSPAVNDGAWHHIVGVLVRGTDTMKVYIDGKLINSTNITAGWNIDSSQNFDIGMLNNNTTFFNGQIDDIRVYNYDLTAQQVKSIYSNGAVSFK